MKDKIVRYEPTMRMCKYEGCANEAVIHLDKAVEHLNLARQALKDMPLSDAMMEYSTIVERLIKTTDMLETYVPIAFVGWQQSEEVLANHHFWSMRNTDVE